MENTQEIQKTIAARFAALRRSRGLSTEEVAERSDMSAKLVTRIENGTSTVTAAQLVILARTLGVETSVLTGETKWHGWTQQPVAAGGAA